MPSRGVPVPRIRPTTPPPALTAKLDAIALLRALKHRWALALALGLLGAGIVAPVAWCAVPPAPYTARTILHVAAKQPSIIFQTREDQVDFPTYQRTQLALIKSRFVLNSALNLAEQDAKRSGVNLDPEKRPPDKMIAWLEKEIQADYAGEILTISMNGTNPDALPVLVNAVTDAYLREVVNVETEERQKRFDELKEIYRRSQKAIGEQREQLKKLANLLGSNDKSTVRLSHQLALESRGIIERELRQLQIDLRRAQTELEVRRQARMETAADGTANVPDSVVDGYIAQDRYMQEYRQRIAQLEQAITRGERIARKKNDPAIQRPLQEIQDLRRKLEDRQKQIRSWCAEHPETVKVAARDPLEQQVQVLKKLVEDTAAELDSTTRDTREINQNSQELDTLQSEIAHADVACRRVGDEIESLKVELNAKPRVRLLEPADKHPRPEADKRPRIAGMAGLGAFGLVLLSVSLLEYRARRISSVDEVVHGLGLSLVGTLPRLPDRSRGRHLGTDESWEDPWSDVLVESIDATRTILLHAAAAESLRAVMVTSAMGGEGKTSLACHLATSLARAGLRTLLLDADLRRPAAHQLFDLLPGPGFSELLRGEVELDDAIQPTPAAGLWMIAAGQGDARAIQLLARPAIGKLLGQLRERFDFIVVDTPPVLPVADALLIGQHVDAAICSILRDVSRIPKVYAANERLLTLGIRLLGAVMAGAHTDAYGSRYSCSRRSPQPAGD